ncbi:glycoside hydrolase family 35 protein [Silvibacterium acidisoli]|uniref:glycoside hydrolase family 35 protein n=1 Tax=Acidobacteriaceae bacterium ZG23-2 TaxID=2883246 RepID=UPI00406C2CB6
MVKPALSSRFLLTTVLATAFFSVRGYSESAPSPSSHTFTVSGRDFLLDGKPYQVISGEMHYPRVPREYWRDRLHKAKLMGLNTITTYAFWNVHEPRPGVFDFSGQNDLAEYLREAQAEGLNVILRPGPYVCAEWELGGFPAWLLKDRNLKLRTADPRYLHAMDLWFARLAREVKPFLMKNGGPIIAVQVENEYGAFGDDRTYLTDVKQALVRYGLGDTVLLTSNQAGDLAKGSLPGVTSAVNFGSGNEAASTAALEAFRPDGVRTVGEYWAGWFDKWGEEHHQTDGKQEAAELSAMLKKGYSVSLYMFHGGTSFGWMNGADSHTGKDYHPDTTSYDYDAPLDEAGNPRYKYALFQKAIADATHTAAAPVPQAQPLATFPVSSFTRTASLWLNLPEPVASEIPLTFEDLGQNYGYVLYRTRLDAGEGGALQLKGLHDYAQIYVDQKLVGDLDRRRDQDTLDIAKPDHAVMLDILVENTGRVNYSHAIQTEQAGLTDGVTLGGKALKSWKNYSLPFDDLSRLHFSAEPCTGPCFLEASLDAQQPADTYLDTRGLHKGQAWVGDHNLGRFWSIGPQYALYLPGPWLRKGENRLICFELRSESKEHLATTASPIYGSVTHDREKQ